MNGRTDGRTEVCAESKFQKVVFRLNDCQTWTYNDMRIRVFTNVPRIYINVNINIRIIMFTFVLVSLHTYVRRKTDVENVDAWFITVRLQGRNLVILWGGRRYIYNRKDEIIHGLCPSVLKCVAPLFRDMSLVEVWSAGGVRPPPVAPPVRLRHNSGVFP